MPPALPPDPEGRERERLAALERLGLLDTPADPTAERVVALTAQLLRAPIAVISLVTADRQWFKAAWGTDLRETPRSQSFCAHALDRRDILEIPDALQDPRFRDSILVTAPPHARFYAGVPLITREGHALGTLCVLDARPRRLSEADRESLHLLGGLVVEHFEYRQSAEREARQQRRLAEIILGTDAGTWEWHIPSGELRINRRWAGMLGHEPEALAPLTYDTWRGLVHPDDLPAAEDALSRHFGGTADYYDCQLRMRHAQGHWVWVHTRGRLWGRHPANGRPEWMSGTHLDITTAKRAEEALRLYASVFLASPDGMMLTAPDHRVLDVNPAYCRATGYTREEIIGTVAALWSDPDNAPIARAVARDGHWRGERWATRRSGAVHPEQVAISSVHDEAGALSHHVTVFSDISHLKEYERRIRHMGLYDPLTDLPNRHLFITSLRDAMAATRHDGRLLGVATLDVDHLKAFNDGHGKVAGDALLRGLAANLEQALGEGDLLARIGGDEFAVMLASVASREALPARLEELHRAVADPGLALGRGQPFTASQGATLYPLDDGDAEQLLRHASQAMYRAKQSGRDCTIVFDADSARDAEQRQHGLWRLREALGAGEFELHYQPRMNMASGEVLAVEALLRWRHPESGLRPPREFLPLLEGSPLELALGEWVLRTAVAEAAALGVAVSVNISARRLLAPGFAELVGATLAAHPALPPAGLELEILEDEAVYDWQAAAPVFGEVRARGVRFSLDDFGTGYSSLVHLRHMPVDTLKIDLGFVQRMLESNDDAAIVESVIRLAAGFDLETVAEGVESTAHAERLMAMGCRVGQGFGLAPPMPAAELGQWLAGAGVRGAGTAAPGLDGSGQQDRRPG